MKPRMKDEKDVDFSLTNDQKVKIDLCVQKYMQSLVIVRSVMQAELRQVINERGDQADDEE